MRNRLPEWLRPSPKGVAENALANILLDWGQRFLLWLIAMVIPSGLLVKVFAVPPTDREWFWWTLYACVAMTITWAAVEFARNQRALRASAVTSLALRRGGDQPRGRAEASAGEQTKTEPVEFTVEGHWLNTPFRFSNIGMNERHQTVYCEDAYLTLTAREPLDSVRVQFIVTMGNPQRVYECWHKGVFEGTVTPGMSEAIRFFRRTFRLVGVDVSNDGREGYTKRHLRHEGEVILFDGTPAEVKQVPWGLMTVKAYVHHRGGRERGSLVIDIDRIHAPRSRLVVGDKVKLAIGNNYMRPFGAAMIYEEGPP